MYATLHCTMHLLAALHRHVWFGCQRAASCRNVYIPLQLHACALTSNARVRAATCMCLTSQQQTGRKS